MFATLDDNGRPSWGAIRRNHRKEAMAGFQGGVKVFSLDPATRKTRTLVDVRYYVSGSFGTTYACLWVYGEDMTTSGSGSFNGCGVDHKSAALAAAIGAAGITLLDEEGKRRYIAGTGEDQAMDAIRAIARMVAPEGAWLHLVTMHP